MHAAATIIHDPSMNLYNSMIVSLHPSHMDLLPLHRGMRFRTNGEAANATAAPSSVADGSGGGGGGLSGGAIAGIAVGSAVAAAGILLVACTGVRSTHQCRTHTGCLQRVLCATSMSTSMHTAIQLLSSSTSGLLHAGAFPQICCLNMCVHVPAAALLLFRRRRRTLLAGEKCHVLLRSLTSIYQMSGKGRALR